MTNPNTISRRYVVDTKGTEVRPFRVYDAHKGTVFIYTADRVVAERMAEEYEKQWLRSTWLRRNWQRVARWLRSLFAKKPAPRPAAAPTIREQRVEFLERLCEKARAETAGR
jgi:hypothetical protein